MTESERRQIIELIKKEVIPAIGCTPEPIAVALCVAKAAETLGVKPEKIDVLLSANILKNAMGSRNPGNGYGRPSHSCGFRCVDWQIRLSVGGVEGLYAGSSGTGKTVHCRKTDLYF